MIDESYSTFTAMSAAGITGIFVYILLQVSNLQNSSQKLILGLSLILISSLYLIAVQYNFIQLSTEHISYLHAFIFASLGYSIVKLINTFIWSGILYSHGAKTPKLITKIFNSFVYFSTLVFIMNFVFNQSIMPYIALTGAGAAFVGYTAKSTLSEIFSGLALNLGKNVSKGDMIKVGGHIGKVNDMDWRSVTLRNSKGALIIIPNSSITGDHIENYTKSNKTGQSSIHLFFPGYIDSYEVIKILKQSMVDFGKPENEYTYVLSRLANTYDLLIKIDNCEYQTITQQGSNFMELFSHSLYANNIHFDLTTNANLHPEKTNNIIRKKVPFKPAEATKLFQKIDGFQYLDKKELSIITDKIVIREYSPQSIISREGSEVHTLCIILEGTCSVYQRNKKGRNIYMRKFTKGNFFGIQSFLLGKPRRTTIANQEPVTIGSLSPHDIKDVILNNEKLSKSLSATLAKRINENQKLINSSNEESPQQKNSLIASIMTSFLKFVKHEK